MTLEEAQAKLADVIHHLAPGDSVVMTENDQPVATLMSQKPELRPRPQAGACKGMLTIVADDDEHLKDFAEYMP